jgi:hypothetical protein
MLAFRGLRDARQTRHGQSITELMREWTEPTVVDAIALHGKYTEREIIELVNKMFGPSEERAKDEELLDGGKLILVANMIETLGVLASEKAITAEVIYKMWGGAILSAWPKWDDAIRNLREYDKQPDTFEHFEWIASEMKRVQRDRRKAAELTARESSVGFL